MQCMEVERGDTLLIITEAPEQSYYDPRVADAVAERATQLGVQTRVLQARLANGPDDVPAEVSCAMQGADHTLFLSQLGDQIRFSADHGAGRKTISYTRDLEYLGSLFGCTPFRLFQDVHDRLLDIIKSAGQYRITAPVFFARMTGPGQIADIGPSHRYSVLREQSGIPPQRCQKT